MTMEFQASRERSTRTSCAGHSAHPWVVPVRGLPSVRLQRGHPERSKVTGVEVGTGVVLIEVKVVGTLKC